MSSIPVLQHVPHESLGLIGETLAEADLDYHYLRLFDCVPETLDLSGAPALVVLGGPMNVDETDRYPHLAAEVAWIRQALDRDLPILGVCLGAQLLAKALGARVYANGVKEIGWYDLDLTDATAGDALFAGSGRRIRVFQWHGDTFDLPSGAVHLAQSKVCRNQAFRYGTAAYGLQFHVEVTPAMVGAWLDDPGNCDELASLNDIDPGAIRASTAGEYAALEPIGRQILGRFAQLAVGRLH